MDEKVNKKINVLAMFPIFGSVILIILLYIKMVKKEIDRKKFFAFLFCTGLFGFVSILLITLLLKFVNSIIDISSFINNTGLIISFVVGGYFMNLYSFSFINKKWSDLEI